MKGIVSALAVNPAGDGFLAAGTFTRHVGLYAANGCGESLGTFSLRRAEDVNREIGGQGVTQLLWSPCGRYLYIAERRSDGVMIYDIRVMGQLLGWLRGRDAKTNQRMRMDLVSVPGADGQGHEIWAGGNDGFMRGWSNPMNTMGPKDPDWEWKVHDGTCLPSFTVPFSLSLSLSDIRRLGDKRRVPSYRHCGSNVFRPTTLHRIR